MSDSYGDASDDVTDELLRSVLPEPVEDREVNEEKVPPLFPVHGRKKRATYRMRNQIQTEVLGLTRKRQHTLVRCIKVYVKIYTHKKFYDNLHTLD